jgi:hypothetical protein
MMNDQKLWEEATMAVIHVQNRSPHHTLKNMTPEEDFFGNNPRVKHLRVGLG